MDFFEKSCVEQSSIEEQEKNITMDDATEENEWNPIKEAVKLVIDGAEDIKKLTDECIQRHFSPEEQEWISPQLFPVHVYCDAGMDDDGKSPFARFQAYDVEGKVVLIAEITDTGSVAFKYRPAGSDTLITDDALYYVDDATPYNPITTMKWALFTTALTYFLKFGFGNLLLRFFYMDTMGCTK